MPFAPRLAVLFAFGCFLAVPGSAQQREAPRNGVEAIRAIGSTVEAGGSPQQRRLFRPGVPEAEARGGLFLQAGDRIVVRGKDAYVEVLLKGASESFDIDESNSPYVVAPARPVGWGQQGLSFLRGLLWPSTTRSFVKRKDTSRRGSGNVAKVSRPVERVARSPWLSSEEIVLPEDLDHVTITWCGDSGGGRTKGTSGAGSFKDQGGFGQVDGLLGGGIHQVSVLDRRSSMRIDFSIRRVARAAIPRPEWLSGTDPLDPEERTAWAAWLYEARSAKYHGFALTLLDDAKFELPAAAQFFGAAVDCRVQPLH